LVKSLSFLNLKTRRKSFDWIMPIGIILSESRFKWLRENTAGQECIDNLKHAFPSAIHVFDTLTSQAPERMKNLSTSWKPLASWSIDHLILPRNPFVHTASLNIQEDFSRFGIF
jgi:hypothetical protein